jgi:hypothetical protein
MSHPHHLAHPGEAPTATGFVRRAGTFIGRGSLIIFAVSLSLALILAIWTLWPKRSIDEIEFAVTEFGFHPVRPANKLRGPGSIYVVEDNHFYHQVCHAQTSDLGDSVQISPSQGRVRERLEKSDFTWSSELVKMLNGKLGGERVTSVSYNLSNVMMHEISDDALKAIQRKLLADSNCEDAVHAYFKEHRTVCLAYAALSASATFRITVTAQVEPDLELIKQHLEEHTGGQIRIVSKDEFSGENLFYGIQLSDIVCPIDDAVPRRDAQRAGDRRVARL